MKQRAMTNTSMMKTAMTITVLDFLFLDLWHKGKRRWS